MSVALTALALATTPPAIDKKAWDFPAEYIGKTVLNKPHGMTEKVVALTFDDGPSPYTTPFVLDSLRKHKAKATFFVVGYMVRHREGILRRIVNEGHVIGNHSLSHKANPPKSVASWEISKTNALIKEVIGRSPNLYRPPYGIRTAQTTLYAKGKGMPIVLWTGSSADTATKDSAKVYRNVMAAVQPGAVILLHDIQPHTAEAVPKILASLAKKGYRCVTVPEMLTAWKRASAPKKG